MAFVMFRLVRLVLTLVKVSVAPIIAVLIECSATFVVVPIKVSAAPVITILIECAGTALVFLHLMSW
jgi:hypothetical protein